MTSLSSQAKPHDWREDYLVHEQAIGEDELRAAVAQLPETIRAKLAQGPNPHRWSCGVCEAFGGNKWAKERWPLDAAPDLTDPYWIVYGYHDVPKARMKRGDQQYYGPLANETYERCIATYRAAGWDGEASEPNA